MFRGPHPPPPLVLCGLMTGMERRGGDGERQPLPRLSRVQLNWGRCCAVHPPHTGPNVGARGTRPRPRQGKVQTQSAQSRTGRGAQFCDQQMESPEGFTPGIGTPALPRITGSPPTHTHIRTHVSHPPCLGHVDEGMDFAAPFRPHTPFLWAGPCLGLTADGTQSRTSRKTEKAEGTPKSLCPGHGERAGVHQLSWETCQKQNDPTPTYPEFRPSLLCWLPPRPVTREVHQA